MTRRVNIVSSTDWFTIVLYLVLVIMGWLNIYAAVYNEEHQLIFDWSQQYGKQMIWIIAALLLAIIIFVIDSKAYTFFAYPVYIFVMLLLLSVLFFGKEVHGARSWFEIGNFRIQPAEFGKVATSLALAKFMSWYNFKLHSFKNLIIISFILFLPAFLIILQNDTGSALVYVAFIIMLFREGLSDKVMIFGILAATLFVLSLVYSMVTILWVLLFLCFFIYWFFRQSLKESALGAGIYILITAIIWGVIKVFNLPFNNLAIMLAGIGFSGMYFLVWSIRKKIQTAAYVVVILWGTTLFTFSVDYIFNEVLEQHQQTRINVLLGIEQDVKDAGYNVNQSKIAIGSGGLYGKGYLQGTQTKLDFVPEQSTDFIFCTVGEEWGFLGTTLVLVLFTVLFLRLIFLAERQRSAFSRIYGYCVLSIIFFHVLINIGMTIGLAPVIGIPLPFFSYGGSSLWAFTILLFIFLRLDASRMQIL